MSAIKLTYLKEVDGIIIEELGSITLTYETAPSTAPIQTISVNGVEQPIEQQNVDIEVPTKTSDLTNDSGFITSDDIPPVTREYSVTIDRQDVVWQYGKVKINHDLSFNLQYKVVNPELIVNFGDGTKYLSPVISYTCAESNSTSAPNGFYIVDADNMLNEFAEFDFIKFSYDVVADTEVKYDCPIENLQNGVVFEESDFWHSLGGVATFNTVYPTNTSQKFETVEDPLVMGNLTQGYTPKYCAVKGADLVSYPYVNGSAADAVGSNPNILSVASHFSNTFGRNDITANAETFLKNTIAVGARLDNAGTDNTGATSYGYGIEFFEVANRATLNEQYPDDITIYDRNGDPHVYHGLGSMWWSYPASVQCAQSPTCAIVAAKFRKIKDATGASWMLCREAARATASNNGVWDMYRGFGIIDPEAAIAYIQAKDKTYLIDKIEAENNKYSMLEYADLKDNTPVPKKHVEAIKETIPVLPAFGDIITHDADEFEPANVNIQQHIADTNNPHGTTAEQVGASPIGHDHSVSDLSDVDGAATTVASGDSFFIKVGSLWKTITESNFLSWFRGLSHTFTQLITFSGNLKTTKIIPNSDTTGVVIRNAADTSDFAYFDFANNLLNVGGIKLLRSNASIDALNNIFMYGSVFGQNGTKYVAGDVAFSRIAAGLWEINSGTAGTLRDLKLRSLYGDKIFLNSLSTAPSSATDTGTTGEIRIDANYIYFCVATNQWKRTPLSTW